MTAAAAISRERAEPSRIRRAARGSLPHVTSSLASLESFTATSRSSRRPTDI